MSTYWHFECLDHDPALPSADEFTQHTDDAAYRNALALAAQRPLDPAWWDGDQGGDGGYMERNARRFLDAHPHCRIAAVSEHGDRVQISQPTPTAEHVKDWTDAQDNEGPGCSCGFNGSFEECAAWRAENPDPPIIADMVPGTTFWARTQNGVLSSTDRMWFVDAAGYVFSVGAHHIDGQRIDPSTIRDVTPPAVTS